MPSPKPLPTMVPDEDTFWPRELIEDVAFMTIPTEEEDELGTFEICAVLRHQYPKHRYINPFDVGMITEWVKNPKPMYGGMKEEIKIMVATLGESEMVSWREGVAYALELAKEKGYDGFDVFEDEDPRRAGKNGFKNKAGEIEGLGAGLCDLLGSSKPRRLKDGLSEKASLPNGLQFIPAEVAGIQAGRVEDGPAVFRSGPAMYRLDWCRMEVNKILKGAAIAEAKFREARKKKRNETALD